MKWVYNNIKSDVFGDVKVYETDLGLNFWARITVKKDGFAQWKIFFSSEKNPDIILYSGVESSFEDAKRIVLDSWVGYVTSLNNVLKEMAKRANSERDK